MRVKANKPKSMSALAAADSLKPEPMNVITEANHFRPRPMSMMAAKAMMEDEHRGLTVSWNYEP